MHYLEVMWYGAVGASVALWFDRWMRRRGR